MSNIVIQVNGSTAGDGFLIAPDNGINFPVLLKISTNDGTTVSATIDVTPNGAGVSVPGGAMSIGPGGVNLQIFATAVSAVRGDTKINVHVGAATTSYTVTGIGIPQIWFRGRFEVRFATDNDWYNDPKGTWGAGNDGNNPLGFGGPPGPGNTFWLEGEPLFAPTNPADSVPTTTDKTGIGRVLRFNNPVAPRSHAALVVTVVDGVRGTLSGANQVYFTSGDPVIGAPVNVGPNTYLAQNWQTSPADAAMGLTPAEFQMNGNTNEPLALFEFHIDGFFSGKPATDADRPQSSGYLPRVDDPNSPIPTLAGIPDFLTFSSARQNQLQADYAGLSAADKPTLNPDGSIMPATGTATGRNLVRRIQHLSAATGNPPSPGPNPGRPGSYEDAWEHQEEYVNGHVNDSITFQPNSSSVMSFLAGYTAFDYYSKLHTFHTDELCGYVYGSFSANPSARLAKTCTLQIQNSTFGKDELTSMGLPANFPAAFWVAMDGFFPSELGIDATDNLTNPPNPPVVSFSVDPPSNTPTIVNALQAQLQIPAFSGPVFTTALPPPNAPQRILYPFNITFTGTDGFVNQTEFLTLTATITVNGKQYTASAPLELTKAANPFVVDADAGNQFTSWLSTDLRVFTVDDNDPLFGVKVSDFYPSNPPTPQGISTAATTYISTVIHNLTQTGVSGTGDFDHSLNEFEDVGISRLEYLPTNPRSGKPAFNFAICRVRIRGTTPPMPPPPFTTQAQNCRVFFRAFQAQTTASTYNTSTTYRSTPIGTPDITPRVPLLGVQTDSMGHEEFVTIPFFAVDRVNLNGPANLTTQSPDTPNVQTISPVTGQEIDTYYGCWLDINQPTLLFPQFAKPGDFDNTTGYFNTTGFATQTINAAFTRGQHQCLIAEIAFDDVPIPPNVDTSTSDKLAQRNLAYIDGPNPGVADSRRMPHTFQVQATSARAKHVDEMMIAWGNTPRGSTASIYLPGVSAKEIISLADSLYPMHGMTIQDAHTILAPWGPLTFVPIPKDTGLLAGLMTVNLPLGVKRGEVYNIVVRQITDAQKYKPGHSGNTVTNISEDRTVAVKAPRKAAPLKNQAPKARRSFAQEIDSGYLKWRRVLGAFQMTITISTKQELLLPEEHQLALFRWIADETLPQSRWYPVMQRYVEQLAGRVAGFGGDPGKILPSPTGNVPGTGRRHHEGDGDEHEHHEVTGKVNGLVFDHFGDFEAFILETELGEFKRFFSRERRVLEIVQEALEDRNWVTVVSEPKRHNEVRAIILRTPPERHG